jgi:CRP-like cAMP-binding protein
MGVLDEGMRSATARAVDATCGYAISRAAFQTLWAIHRPGTCGFLHRLVNLLAQRLRTTTERMVAIEEGPPSPGLELPDTGSDRDASLPRERPTLPVSHVASLPFFRDHPPAELKALLARMNQVRAPRGHVVFREGDPPTSCFVVVRGAVQVSAEGNGFVRKLAVLPPGSVFGEMALFDRGRRSASCMARERTVLLELEAAAFDEMLEAESATAFRFMRAVSGLLIRSLRRADRRHAWLVASRRHRLRAGDAA